MISSDKLVDILKQSIHLSELEQSKIPIDLATENNPLLLKGMSGKKTRHFLNNICSNEDIRYIEIGLWRGSTFCSAMYNNKITCMGVDNWSQFEPVESREEFFENLAVHRGDNKVCLFEQDYRTVVDRNETIKFKELDIDLDTFKWNVLFFDGPHLKEEHECVLKAFDSILDQNFILIIDDWNQYPVADGTRQMLSDYRGEIAFEHVITTHGNDTNNDWHNGIAMFVIAR